MRNVQHSSNRLMRGRVIVGGSLALSLLPGFPAFAHHPMGGMTPETLGQALLSGLAHPIIGPDHLAFLLVVTLLSFALSGRARFLMPLAFVAATVGGTVLHLGLADVPMVEVLVAASVVVGGLLALLRSQPGAAVLLALFTLGGLLHGYAYGEAIVGAETGPVLSYLLGFSAIQYGLIVAGMAGLTRIGMRSESLRATVARTGSVAAVLAGGVFLALSLA